MSEEQRVRTDELATVPTRWASLIDAREQMVHQRILGAVVRQMTGREFREWFSGHRAISGREFYEGKP